MWGDAYGLPAKASTPTYRLKPLFQTHSNKDFPFIFSYLIFTASFTFARSLITSGLKGVAVLDDNLEGNKRLGIKTLYSTGYIFLPRTSVTYGTKTYRIPTHTDFILSRNLIGDTPYHLILTGILRINLVPCPTTLSQLIVPFNL